jgi:uncharacterized protein YfiM (DUF2279 family)
MEISPASLTSGTAAAVGTTVTIDVFRAFTTAAVAALPRRPSHRDGRQPGKPWQFGVRASVIIALGKEAASSRSASTSAIHQPNWDVPR